MAVFGPASDKILGYQATDCVLDIGCGPGYLESFLENKVGEIHALDISPRYLEECRKKFADHRNLHFHSLGDDYLDFSFLGNKRFHKILCLSVIQYYRNAEEVLTLVRRVQAFAHPGARLLIADIPRKGALGFTVLHALRHAYLQGGLVNYLKFLFRSLGSEYSRTLAGQGLLQFAPEELSSLIADIRALRVSLVKLISTPMTLCENRVHILIEY